MKELETEFIGIGEVRGFAFKQMLTSPEAYIYRVTDEGRVHYEVFERKENTRFGCVSYPSAKAFGTWAFSIKNWADAVEKFRHLSEKEPVTN